jgi:hypothetical protein
MLPIALQVTLSEGQRVVETLIEKRRLHNRPVKADQIPMSEPVGGVVSDNGIPALVNSCLVLEAKKRNPSSLLNMKMPIPVIMSDSYGIFNLQTDFTLFTISPLWAQGVSYVPPVKPFYADRSPWGLTFLYNVHEIMNCHHPSNPSAVSFLTTSVNVGVRRTGPEEKAR